MNARFKGGHQGEALATEGEVLDTCSSGKDILERTSIKDEALFKKRAASVKKFQKIGYELVAEVRSRILNLHIWSLEGGYNRSKPQTAESMY